MNSATITLLIPCYNAARYLPRLAESVGALTRPFDRVLCYDDGSTDDTVAVARALGFEILDGNANRGVAHARNRLAAAAATEWIHFHDADDRIAPGFLEKLLPLADEAADVVSADADWISEDDGSLQIAWRYEASALAADPAAHLLARPLGLNNSLIRRSLWQRIGGCDESLAMWEDADVHFRLALAGARWRHHAEVLTWSLRHATSFSHNLRRNWACRLAALEKYAATPAARRLEPLIASEAAKAAAHLLAHGAPADARSALALNHRLGGDAPETAHPVLRLAKVFLPALTILRLQNLRRQR